MGYLVRLQAILLGWTVAWSGGTVTISVVNGKDGGNQLECDTEVTLVCRIDPYANLINWEINGTLYAMCSPTCLDNPPFPGNYSFSFDVTNGIFNVTVNQVTFGDSSTTFKCDDGSELDSITTEVVPAYSRNMTDVDSTDEEYQVVFTTACVHPDVEFTWYTVKGNNTGPEVYKTDQNKSEDINSCALDNQCGGTGTVKVSSAVSVKKVSDGEEGFLEVIVKYKNPDEQRTFRFNEKFVFEEEASTTVRSAPTYWCGTKWCTWVIVCGIIGGLLLIAQICLFCIICFTTEEMKELMELKRIQQNWCERGEPDKEVQAYKKQGKEESQKFWNDRNVPHDCICICPLIDEQRKEEILQILDDCYMYKGTYEEFLADLELIKNDSTWKDGIETNQGYFKHKDDRKMVHNSFCVLIHEWKNIKEWQNVESLMHKEHTDVLRYYKEETETRFNQTTKIAKNQNKMELLLSKQEEIDKKQTEVLNKDKQIIDFLETQEFTILSALREQKERHKGRSNVETGSETRQQEKNNEEIEEYIKKLIRENNERYVTVEELYQAQLKAYTDLVEQEKEELLKSRNGTGKKIRNVTQGSEMTSLKTAPAITNWKADSSTECGQKEIRNVTQGSEMTSLKTAPAITNWKADSSTECGQKGDNTHKPNSSASFTQRNGPPDCENDSCSASDYRKLKFARETGCDRVLVGLGLFPGLGLITLVIFVVQKKCLAHSNEGAIRGGV